jgi:hypothetical protein
VALPLRIAPLITYTGSFAVWPGTLVAGDRRAPDGCIAPSEGALMLAGRGESNQTLGQIIGTSRQLVGMWGTAARFPADEHLATMEAKLGIPVIAWQLWRSSAEVTPAVVPPPPPEVNLPDAAPMALPDADGENVVAKALSLLTYLSTPGLTMDELAQAREIRQAITLEARLRGAMMATSKAKLHDHPDWSALIDQLVTALAVVPGALDTLEAFLVKFANARAEE